MADKPLMPIATAVWLIDNTGLTFDQIAEFCVLHPLQVKGIADGDVGGGVRGIDPITTAQLTREEIDKGEADTGYKLKLSQPKTKVAQKTKKAPRYTPVSKRQNRPDAIAWLVKFHPEMSDAQISKLLGTTKTTITAIRDRTHWNSANLEPRDPVGLGLCSQLDLDAAVQKAAAKAAKLRPATVEGPALKPVEETVPQTATESAEEESGKVDLGNVFSNFEDMKEAEETDPS
ncbi:MAG: cell cycle transcriptional regulator TrcR [Pseudomonadota bacterium]